MKTSAKQLGKLAIYSLCGCLYGVVRAAWLGSGRFSVVRDLHRQHFTGEPLRPIILDDGTGEVQGDDD